MKKVLFLLLPCILILSSCVVYVDNDGFFTLDIIKEAKARILAENPDLELSFYEFTAMVSHEYGTSERGNTTIDDLISWNFIFDCNDGHTATISKENGVWQPSHITSLTWSGMAVFDAGYLRIDLDEAIEILKISHLGGGAAGENLFDLVTFHQPLHPDITEPLYNFHVGTGNYVSVGAITGIVQK